MIWIRELLRAAVIILWIVVAWTACAMMAHEVEQWHVEVTP